MTCTYCGKEIKRGNPCNKGDIALNGRVFQRQRNEDSGTCEDCGAPQGSFHHSTCDLEGCPRCGRQFYSCNCEEADIPFPRTGAIFLEMHRTRARPESKAKKSQMLELRELVERRKKAEALR